MLAHAGGSSRRGMATPRSNRAASAVAEWWRTIDDDLGERACAPGKTPSGHGGAVPQPGTAGTRHYRLSAIGYRLSAITAIGYQILMQRNRLARGAHGEGAVE